MMSLKGREDEQAQGQTILSSHLSQEEVLKPPILCEGIAAPGFRRNTHAADTQFSSL